jgi:acyl-CoA reductase-like NAD-dependent aldehyde dehydrogenase
VLLSSQNFIDGTWFEPDGTERTAVVCPSTEEVLGYCPAASDHEVGTAVAAARRAFDSGPWRRMSGEERAAVVERATLALSERADDLGHLQTSEMGAPIGMSVAGARRASATGAFFADVARSTPVAELRNDGIPAAVLREPVGVVAAIAPWNGPVGMALGKILPALLAGCSVVFKPSPETPFDIAFLVDALAAEGLPPGVLNVCSGGASTGAALVRQPGIDKVSFTGSTAAGRQIAEVCAPRFTRLQLELGGKSAAIVLDDADLDQVTAGLSVGCFFNSGQVCAALSRVLAPRALYDDVVEAVVRASKQWVVGDPFDPSTTLGPLVSKRQRDTVENYIRLGVEAGASVVQGGGRPPGLDKGWFIEPTVLAGVDNHMRVAREEIFGPVAVVIPYDGDDDAVSIANDSDYGLHGAVFTSNPDRAMAMAGAVRTGTFSINNFVYNNRAPFGGVKNSGIGRDSGREGYESYLELKTVNVDASTAALFQN